MCVIDHFSLVSKDVSETQVEEKKYYYYYLPCYYHYWCYYQGDVKKYFYVHRKPYFTYEVNNIIQSSQFPVLEFFKCFCSQLYWDGAAVRKQDSGKNPK